MPKVLCTDQDSWSVHATIEPLGYGEIFRLKEETFRIWTTSTSTAATIDVWPTANWGLQTLGTATSDSIVLGNTETANAIWGLSTWQDTVHTNTVTNIQRVRQAAVVLTPEEVAAGVARRVIQRQDRLKANARKTRFHEAANARARRLLMTMLDDAQKDELEKDNRFHLTVHDPDGAMRVYRIDYGYMGNVKLIDTSGRPVKSYCIHADSRLPKEDQMLAQKLLLEANEKEFLRIANMTRIRAA